MERIYFTREFTKDLLKGLRHFDSISFPTSESCVAWMHGINAKHVGGKLEYCIVDSAFQNYQR